jgi:EmrB/QacA subfamily drug resistance transporter
MNAPAATPVALSHSEIRSILLAVTFAMFIGALDQTTVATALPTIGRSLGDIALLPWVVTIYMITGTAVTPLYGKAADIYGRRVMILVAVAISVLGSIGAALAPSMPALIVARAFQGLGGGGLISLAQTTLADLVPPRERGRYQAYFSGVFAVASVVGPVIGGFVAEHLSWPLIFWINVPLGAAALLMCNTRLKAMPRHERPHKLDFVGAALLMASTIAFLLALSWGGGRYPWLSPPILGLVASAAILGALFAVRLRTAPEPLVPLEILANPLVIYAMAATSCTMGIFFGLVVFIPIYFELVIGLPASGAGLALIPLMVGTVSGAIFAGRMMMRMARYKRPTLASLAIATAAMATLALVPVGLPMWMIEVLLLVISFGIGTTLPVTLVSVQNVVPTHQLGTATATTNFFRQLSGAFAVAVFGAIVLGGSAGGLSRQAIKTGLLPADAEMAGLFAYVFAAAAFALVVAFVTILLMEERPLRSSHAPPR